MPTFSFQARNMQGKVVKGSIDAENDLEARVKLKSQHLIPLKLKEKAKSNKDIISLVGFATKKSISSKELQSSTRQFSTLIDAGIPILQAISILASTTQNRNLKEALLNVHDRIQGGSDLSDALSANSQIFDTAYVSMVKAGETAGALDITLRRIAEYIEKSERIKGKVIAALWYPAGVLIISGVVIAVMMIYVIPKFEELFLSSGMELPAITRFIINTSHFVKDYWYLIILAIIALVVGAINFYQTKNGRILVDSILIQLPLFGTLIQKNALARSCRTFSSMLSSGVFVLDSLDISGNTAGNHFIQEAFKNAKTSIIEGESIIVPFSKNKYIPGMVVQMMGIGEQTGSLDKLMEKLANFYEDEVERSTSGLISTIEPLMIIFLGLIIGFIVISLYLPIFQLSEGVT